jgi:hypothetical protein
MKNIKNKGSLILSFALMTGFTAQLSSQTVHIIPKDHAKAEGYNSGISPLSNGINRTMYIFDKWGVTVPNGGFIQKVGFRQDGFRAAAGKKIQVQIFMGHTIQPLDKVSSIFSKVYSTPRQEVYTKKIYQLPTFSVPPKAPSTQLIMLPLDKPFKYDATKNLVLEYVVHANSNGNKRFNYPTDLAKFISPSAVFGKGCLTSGSKSPLLKFSSSYIGGSLSAFLSNGPASSGGLIFYGLSNKKLIGTIPLPLSLDFLGAKGCKLFVDIQLPLAFSTSSSGSGVKRFLLPNDPKLYGIKVFAQTLNLDLFANNAGYVTSNGASVVIGAFPPVARMYSASLSAKSSFVSRNWGDVHAFEVK